MKYIFFCDQCDWKVKVSTRKALECWLYLYLSEGNTKHTLTTGITLVFSLKKALVKTLTYARSSNPRRSLRLPKITFALFIHLFLFKLSMTGIIRKRINWIFSQYICCFHLANLNVSLEVLKSIHSANRGSAERYAIWDSLENDGFINLECGGQMLININETLHYDRVRLYLYAERWNVRKFAKKNKEIITYRREKSWKKIDIWTRNAYLKKIDIPKFHLI